MAREILFMHAIGEAMASEMERDPTVLLIGEDVAGGCGAPGGPDSVGGIMGVTKGLYTRYPGRILDTPISESALVGAGVGAAVAGMRPIVELMFVDFLGVCFDQIFNQAAKIRYMFGGKTKVPLVVRTLCGGKASAAAQHSQMLTPIFTHIPGLKVVCPSNPYDLKGLLIQAIRDDDPVIFMEHKALLSVKGDVPAESYTIPFGEANVLREGKDVTIVTYGLMVHFAMGAAQELAKAGVQCEVIDLRTLSPLDEDTILESVEQTGRLVIVDEAYPRCSIAADISSMVAEKGFSSLKAPIAKVTAPHCPVPFAKVLEDAFVPSPERIGEAVMRVMSYKGDAVSGQIHALIVPKWGLTMERGKLTRWIKAVGDRVEKGMEVCDLETEKIANGVEAPASGILRRIVAVEGDVLGLGALLGIIAGESASEAEIDAAVARYQAEAEAAASDAPGAEGPSPST